MDKLYSMKELKKRFKNKKVLLRYFDEKRPFIANFADNTWKYPEANDNKWYGFDYSNDIKQYSIELQNPIEILKDFIEEK